MANPSVMLGALPSATMHRSVSAITGAILIAFGVLSVHPVALFVLVATGVMFMVVAITGRPEPDLSIPKEIGAVLLLAVVAIALVAFGAYLDR